MVAFLVAAFVGIATAEAPAYHGMDEYFKIETAKISGSCLSNIQSAADWEARRPELRRQAAEMLGLDPLPERTDLHAVITGKLEEDTFRVEKLYFQSLPHLYVTANLYLPKNISKPAPAILYLCGHSEVISNGVSFGNKTAYQHHGIWFARNGYACLIPDTLQWGEILGRHHGTYDEGAWWWNSRGYTPAGIETWNAIRGLDYLVSRPEVDPQRIGVTGRSGGGAYSWFVAAMDDRIKVVAPVAGIADLGSYVGDGTVAGHCDCMFLVNTYRWDYPMLAALCAPRPLMLANTDADALFPLSGVMRTRNKVKQIYDLYGASTNFGLVIGPGPHKDTQDVQVPVFRWFNIHLKHEDPVIEMAAVKQFTPGELRVLEKIPDDQINTSIQSSFVPMAPLPKIPTSVAEWRQLQDGWMKDLREKCFAGWPVDSAPPHVTRIFSREEGAIEYEADEIESQPGVALRLFLMRPAKAGAPKQINLRIADGSFTNAPLNVAGSGLDIAHVRDAFGSREFVDQLIGNIKRNHSVEVAFYPRVTGETTKLSVHDLTVMRRKFMLLGQTLDGMRVWDIRRAIEALHSMKEYGDAPLSLEASGEMAVNALYASLFEPVQSLRLRQLPASHAEGPDYLSILKILDIPEATAMAAQKCSVSLAPAKAGGWDFLRTMMSSPSANLKVEMVKSP